MFDGVTLEGEAPHIGFDHRGLIAYFESIAAHPFADAQKLSLDQKAYLVDYLQRIAESEEQAPVIRAMLRAMLAVDRGDKGRSDAKSKPQAMLRATGLHGRGTVLKAEERLYEVRRGAEELLQLGKAETRQKARMTIALRLLKAEGWTPGSSGLTIEDAARALVQTVKGRDEKKPKNMGTKKRKYSAKRKV